MAWLTKARHWVFQLLRCPLCRCRSSSALGCCAGCASELFKPMANVDQVVLGEYQGALKQAVLALKFNHVTRLSRLFGQALAHQVRRQGWQIDLVCAVPLHLTRRFGRGYNQAALIAKITARELAVPYRPVLYRRRPTRQQAKLGAAARRANVTEAFGCRTLNGERVLLIDDVITSGATITECSLALFEAGAHRVQVAAVALAKAER
ncbi:MAG: ComF family protein [Truepera sp.]|nr:ComF family protein [Truepera sp.]